MLSSHRISDQALNLRAGELVEIRSEQEILATLDEDGANGGLPFMPEMLAFCGRRFRVYKRAHKSCDTVHKTGGIRMANAVHLVDARCDGSAHGGCEAGCLLFWKEAWLRRVRESEPAKVQTVWSKMACPELLRKSAVHPARVPTQETIRYRCQATELPRATASLPWWKIGQYVEDVTSGNVGMRQLARGAGYSVVRQLAHIGIGYRVLVAFYNWFHRRRGATTFPFKSGTLDKTPAGEPLNLVPGEWVRVKSVDQIMGTLDKRNRNRGLHFDPEMTLFCGGTYQVLKRVTHIIDERSGEMLTFGNSCIMLDGVYCRGETTEGRLFCPRAIYAYWREIWLERVPAPSFTLSGSQKSATR